MSGTHKAEQSAIGQAAEADALLVAGQLVFIDHDVQHFIACFDGAVIYIHGFLERLHFLLGQLAREVCQAVLQVVAAHIDDLDIFTVAVILLAFLSHDLLHAGDLGTILALEGDVRAHQEDEGCHDDDECSDNKIQHGAFRTVGAGNGYEQRQHHKRE